MQKGDIKMSEIKIIFPNLVAELARAGITVTELAERLQCSRAVLYKKLCGEVNFYLKDAFAIQAELKKSGLDDADYTLDYLFTMRD